MASINSNNPINNHQAEIRKPIIKAEKESIKTTPKINLQEQSIAKSNLANTENANYFKLAKKNRDNAVINLNNTYQELRNWKKVDPNPNKATRHNFNEIVNAKELMNDLYHLRNKISQVEENPRGSKAKKSKDELVQTLENYWNASHFLTVNKEENTEETLQHYHEVGKNDFAEINIHSLEEIKNYKDLDKVITHLCEKTISRTLDSLEGLDLNHILATKHSNPEKSLQSIDQEFAKKLIEDINVALYSIRAKRGELHQSQQQNRKGKKSFSPSKVTLIDPMKNILRMIQKNPHLRSINSAGLELDNGEKYDLSKLIKDTIETENIPTFTRNMELISTALRIHRDKTAINYSLRNLVNNEAPSQEAKEKLLKETHEISPEQKIFQKAINLHVHDTLNYFHQGGINLRKNTNYETLQSKAIKTVVDTITEKLNEDIRLSLINETELGQKINEELPKIDFFIDKGKHSTAEEIYEFWHLVLQDSFPDASNEEKLRSRDFNKDGIDFFKYNASAEESEIYNDVGYQHKINWGRFNEAKIQMASVILKQELQKQNIKLETMTTSDFGLLNRQYKIDGFFKLSLQKQTKANQEKIEKLKGLLAKNKKEIIIPFQIKSNSNTVKDLNKNIPFILHLSPENKNLLNPKKVGDQILSDKLLDEIIKYAENLNENWSSSENNYSEHVTKWAKADSNINESSVNPNQIDKMKKSFKKIKAKEEANPALFELSKSQENMIISSLFK